MKFQPRSSDEPEINLIPFIDVLLVILIFLMLTTTYNKFTELQLTLPTANVDAAKDRPREVILSIAADGRYAVNRQPLSGNSVTELAAAIHAAADKNSTLIISADAQSTHQAVMTALEAARREGLVHITFAAQSGQEE